MKTCAVTRPRDMTGWATLWFKMRISAAQDGDNPPTFIWSV